MDELEDRVRRALQHPSVSAAATEVLADVHRGVRNRQQRRLAIGAAALLAVLTATGLLAAPSTGPGNGPDRPSGSPSAPTTTPTTTPSESSATTRARR